MIPTAFAAIFSASLASTHESEMNQAAKPRPEEPTCKCDVCGEEMKLLGNLPDTQNFAAARVFRCYRCNNVTSEQW